MPGRTALAGEGTPTMATRSLSNFRPQSSPTVIEITRFCGISRTAAQKRLTSNCETEMGTSASEMGLGCVRGTTLALAIEMGTALALYLLWRLCHLTC